MTIILTECTLNTSEQLTNKIAKLVEHCVEHIIIHEINAHGLQPDEVRLQALYGTSHALCEYISVFRSAFIGLDIIQPCVRNELQEMLEAAIVGEKYDVEEFVRNGSLN